MKKLKIFGLVVGVLFVLLIASFLIFPGRMLKTTVNTAGPLALGVDVHIEKAVFRLLRGQARLDGLFIGNPKGFNAKSLCEVGTIRVDLEPASLKTDTIIINEIYVEAPVFTYQTALLKSNISALLKNLEGDSDDSDTDEEAADEEAAEEVEEGGKKVIISRIFIKDPMVKLSIKGIPAGAPIPLPDIELIDVGKETDGAGVTEVLSKVFGSVLSAVTKIATGSVKLVGKGAGAAVGLLKGAGAGLINVTKGESGDEADSDDEKDAETKE